MANSRTEEEKKMEEEEGKTKEWSFLVIVIRVTLEGLSSGLI